MIASLSAELSEEKHRNVSLAAKLQRQEKDTLDDLSAVRRSLAEKEVQISELQGRLSQAEMSSISTSHIEEEEENENAVKETQEKQRLLSVERQRNDLQAQLDEEKKRKSENIAEMERLRQVVSQLEAALQDFESRERMHKELMEDYSRLLRQLEEERQSRHQLQMLYDISMPAAASTVKDAVSTAESSTSLLVQENAALLQWKAQVEQEWKRQANSYAEALATVAELRCQLSAAEERGSEAEAQRQRLLEDFRAVEDQCVSLRQELVDLRERQRRGETNLLTALEDSDAAMALVGELEAQVGQTEALHYLLCFCNAGHSLTHSLCTLSLTHSFSIPLSIYLSLSFFLFSSLSEFISLQFLTLLLHFAAV